MIFLTILGILNKNKKKNKINFDKIEPNIF